MQSKTTQESLNGQILVMFMAIAMGMLHLGIWIASRLVLFQVYGRERVLREHLQMVRIKPRLQVSNGDILWHRGLEHFLISGVIWIPATVCLFALAWHWWPDSYRSAVLKGTTSSGWAIFAAILIFFGSSFVSVEWSLSLAFALPLIVILRARTQARAHRDQGIILD